MFYFLKNVAYAWKISQYEFFFTNIRLKNEGQINSPQFKKNTLQQNFDNAQRQILSFKTNQFKVQGSARLKGSGLKS